MTRKPTAKRIGRPSDYTEALALRICERIADGESLRKVCLDPDMPSKASVFTWLRLHPAFLDHYARAREAAADSMVDDMLAIADDSAGDITVTEDGRTIANLEHVQRSRLKVDTRKWIASKLRPKAYGDRTAIDMTITDDRDDAELLHEARQIAARMGIDLPALPSMDVKPGT